MITWIKYISFNVWVRYFVWTVMIYIQYLQYQNLIFKSFYSSLKDFMMQIGHLHNWSSIMARICTFCLCHEEESAVLDTLRPRQNGRHFPDDIFKWFFLNENVWISITISLRFVPRGPINNIPTLVQVMARRRPGNKPLSEPMMVRLPTHICVIQPQWVKTYSHPVTHGK